MDSSISVLVADDEPDLRLLVRVVLERAGFEVVEEAIDGDDVLAAVARLAPPPVPTVMVLDNQMPRGSGLEVARRVLHDTPGQRIILFSALLDADVRQQANQIGIRACIPKTDVHRLPAVIAEVAAD
jgi:CheY-like chemotaxis protein